MTFFLECQICADIYELNTHFWWSFCAGSAVFINPFPYISQNSQIFLINPKHKKCKRYLTSLIQEMAWPHIGATPFLEPVILYRLEPTEETCVIYCSVFTVGLAIEGAVHWDIHSISTQCFTVLHRPRFKSFSSKWKPLAPMKKIFFFIAGFNNCFN